jgi:hypothetical protein
MAMSRTDYENLLEAVRAGGEAVWDGRAATTENELREIALFEGLRLGDLAESQSEPQKEVVAEVPAPIIAAVEDHGSLVWVSSDAAVEAEHDGDDV